jgi:bacillithiol biosynthesis deacetylase BshB1
VLKLKRNIILIFGAHPDDIEIGMGGFIADNKDSEIIMCDLTLGEMGSNGNIEIREKEALKSQSVLNVKERINLSMADRNIIVDKKNIEIVSNVIRKYKPKIVFAPYPKDYHPDHENCSKLVREAVHLAGLIKFKSNYEKHRPDSFIYYYINDIENQNFYYNISEVIEKKIEALSCHESQFGNDGKSVKTYLNNDFIDKIVTRDKYYGNKCGVNYCETFHKVGAILVNNIWEI